MSLIQRCVQGDEFLAGSILEVMACWVRGVVDGGGTFMGGSSGGTLVGF